jgi:hypothetical protein
MMHALVIDGAIERFDGDPSEVATTLSDFEDEGITVGYLFSAVSEEEFTWKEREAGSRQRIVTIRI